MLGGPFQRCRQVLRVGIDRARHVGCLRRQRDGDRIERLLHRAQGRGLRHRARARGGRVLPLRQPVDAVVEKDDVQIDVAADGVQQVVAADRKAVAVAGDHPDAQVGVGNGKSGRQRRRAPVYRVDAVCVHVIGETAGAADAGDEDGLLFGRARLRQHPLHLRQDRIVAAAGAPAHRLVGDEILAGEGDFFGRACAHLSSPEN